MAAKNAAFVATLLTLIVIGVSIFLVMLMGMNGYSESDATYGLATYAILAFCVTVLVSLLSAFSAGKLINKEFNSVLAVLISVVLFSIVGAILKAVCCIIGIGISEFVRVNF